MKIQEMLLLELREILDRTKYGGWIDTNNMKYYTVAYQGHSEWVKNNANITGWEDDYAYTYKHMFSNNWVRVIHDSDNEIGVQGVLQDIKKAMRIVRPSLKEVSALFIDERAVKNYVESINHFYFPEDRAKLQQFLANIPSSQVQEAVLTELRDLIDTSVYGHWIDTREKNFYPVEEVAGHEQWAIDHAEDFGFDITGGTNPYHVLWEEDWVRIAHSSGTTLSLQGYYKPVITALKMLRRMLLNFEAIYINISGGNPRTGIDYDDANPSFQIPEDREALIQFIQGGSVQESTTSGSVATVTSGLGGGDPAASIYHTKSPKKKKSKSRNKYNIIRRSK